MSTTLHDIYYYQDGDSLLDDSPRLHTVASPKARLSDDDAREELTAWLMLNSNGSTVKSIVSVQARVTI